MSERILVIKLGALGDFIYALGPMKAIRAHHSAAHITLLTTQPFAGLARDCGYLDAILIDEKPKWYQPVALRRLARTLNEQRFTRVYDLQNNDRTAGYLRLLKPRPEWVGAASGASHRNISPERTSGHAFHGHAQTLAMAGIDRVDLDTLLWMKGDLERFDLHTPYVLLIAGCAPTRPEKRWPAAGYREIAKRLLAAGIQPVLLGGAAEVETNTAIASGLPVLDLTGMTSLYDIAALARGALGAIGNDTGPAHIIAVTGAKLVMLFCSASSTVLKHGPQGAQAMTIEAPALNAVAPDEVWGVTKELFKL